MEPRTLFAALAGAILTLALTSALGGPREDAQAALAAGKDPVAVKLLTPLAEQGDPGAQYDLAGLYNRGRGVPQSPAEAVKWFRKAAEQSYAPAQFALAGQYEFGTGVAQSYAESLQWYRKAALAGSEPAMSMLAVKYQDGIGVPKSAVQAHAWFSLAAAAGSANAVAARDRLAGKLSPAELAESKKLALEWRPPAKPSGNAPPR